MTAVSFLQSSGVNKCIEVEGSSLIDKRKIERGLIQVRNQYVVFTDMDLECLEHPH